METGRIRPMSCPHSFPATQILAKSLSVNFWTWRPKRTHCRPRPRRSLRLTPLARKARCEQAALRSQGREWSPAARLRLFQPCPVYRPLRPARYPPRRRHRFAALQLTRMHAAWHARRRYAMRRCTCLRVAAGMRSSARKSRLPVSTWPRPCACRRVVRHGL